MVLKSKEYGFNLGKTFENYLKHLMTQFSTGNSVNTIELSQNNLIMAGGEGFEDMHCYEYLQLSSFKKAYADIRRELNSKFGTEKK